MNPTEYQRLAERTECDQLSARNRRNQDDIAHKFRATRINHAVQGLTGEVGELATTIEKWIQYGQDLDIGNLKEELGDCLWYIAEACNALGFDMGDVMAENIAKLMQRYPEKFSEEKALEENRDREAEQNAAKGLEPCNFDEAVENVIKQGEKESREQLEVMAKLLKSSTIFCG